MKHAQSDPTAGFSLMETLVALAILSISATLIFQSLLRQSELIARVENTSLKASHESIQRAGFTDVVAGLVPSWPEDINSRFHATPTHLSGLTGHPLIRKEPGLEHFQFKLEGAPSQLVYIRGEEKMVLASFTEGAHFSYLGADSQWHETWPPEDIRPDAGPFDDSAAFAVAPLPLAVRIQTETQAQLDWVARLDWRAPRLPRRRDVEDD